MDRELFESDKQCRLDGLNHRRQVLIDEADKIGTEMDVATAERKVILTARYEGIGRELLELDSRIERTEQMTYWDWGYQIRRGNDSHLENRA